MTIRICIYLGIERGPKLGDLLHLPDGVSLEDTFKRVFKRLCPQELERCLYSYGKDILSSLTEKQTVIDGNKMHGESKQEMFHRILRYLEK